MSNLFHKYLLYYTAIIHLLVGLTTARKTLKKMLFLFLRRDKIKQNYNSLFEFHTHFYISFN